MPFSRRFAFRCLEENRAAGFFFGAAVVKARLRKRLQIPRA
jgi:hypothetical protein